MLTPTRTRIAIENSIPLPTDKNTHEVYPFTSLQNGQSFLATDTPYAMLVVLAANASIILGHTFLVRETDNGVRVWRND